MYSIGIDLGGTNIAAGIVDENYNLIKKASIPTGADRDATAIIDDMAKLVNTLISDASLTPDDIIAAGIASPGSVNPERGTVEYANNLPFKAFPICSMLAERTGIKKVCIDNDANAAALGEAVAGAAKGAKDSVMITLGTGVGGGIIIDGKIYSGFNYAGAELGHIVIVYDGVPCSCGRKGCWEAYSSATALVRMTKEKMEANKDSKMWELCSGDINRASGKTSFNAAREGDKAAIELVDEYISYLACGICNILNIFQPEIISIGGGISNEKSNLIDPLIAKVREQEYGAKSGVDRPFTQIKIAELRNDAGIIGAAALR